MVRVLIHLRLDLQQWDEEKEMEALLKEEMLVVQEALKPGGGRQGLAFNMATSGGSGGNTTTGESARKLFGTPDIRERLVALCPQEHQETFRRCLFYDNTLLRLMSSSRLLDVEAVEKLCVEQALRYVSDLGGWIEFPDTVHELYAHLPQALDKNGGRGLKEWSEESLEKMHKVCRSVREKRACMRDAQSNLRDTARRLNIKSDPVVRTIQPVIHCKVCRSVLFIKIQTNNK